MGAEHSVLRSLGSASQHFCTKLKRFGKRKGKSKYLNRRVQSDLSDYKWDHKVGRRASFGVQPDFLVNKGGGTSRSDILDQKQKTTEKMDGDESEILSSRRHKGKEIQDGDKSNVSRTRTRSHEPKISNPNKEVEGKVVIDGDEGAIPSKGDEKVIYDEPKKSSYLPNKKVDPGLSKVEDDGDDSDSLGSFCKDSNFGHTGQTFNRKHQVPNNHSQHQEHTAKKSSSFHHQDARHHRSGTSFNNHHFQHDEAYPEKSGHSFNRHPKHENYPGNSSRGFNYDHTDKSRHPHPHEEFFGRYHPHNPQYQEFKSDNTTHRFGNSSNHYPQREEFNGGCTTNGSGHFFNDHFQQQKRHSSKEFKGGTTGMSANYDLPVDAHGDEFRRTKNRAQGGDSFYDHRYDRPFNYHTPEEPQNMPSSSSSYHAQLNSGIHAPNFDHNAHRFGDIDRSFEASTKRPYHQEVRHAPPEWEKLFYDFSRDHHSDQRDFHLFSEQIHDVPTAHYNYGPQE